jgi:hypothetical protein
LPRSNASGVNAQNNLYVFAELDCGTATGAAEDVVVKPRELETAWTDNPRSLAICVTLMP